MIQLTESQQKAIARLLANNQKLEAIKLLREITKLDLRVCKDFIDNLSDVVISNAQTGNVGGNVPENTTNQDYVLTQTDYRHIEGLLKAGRDLEAIKFIREKTSKGLKESKDMVDALKEQLKTTRDTSKPSDNRSNNQEQKDRSERMHSIDNIPSNSTISTEPQGYLKSERSMTRRRGNLGCMLMLSVIAIIVVSPILWYFL